MYEGELTELTPTETENPLSGYGKTVSHVVIGLKTVKGTKQLRLDPAIYEAILKEKIVVGDVVYVEANTGAVKVGCFIHCLVSYLTDFNSVSAVQMHMHHHMIWSQRHMSRSRRAMSTNEKNLSKM